MTSSPQDAPARGDAPPAASKVPEVTLLFWALKVVATTVGETGGDALSMQMGIGYLAATAVFGAVFALAVAYQVRARGFRPFAYWATIVATTTLGTTLADFADRSLGIGYAGGSALLLALLAGSLWLWHRTLGTIAVATITTPAAESFYWLTIMSSQTLGTALGDWTADAAGFGYAGGAIAFSAMLGLLALAYRFTRVSRTVLFWAAFVLTRPLGAVLGDFLDKPAAHGGLALSRYSATAVLLAFLVGGILLFRHRAGRSAH